MTTPDILAPVVALTLPDSAALSQRAQTALAFIRDFKVDSQEAYGLAAEELQTIKARANKLEEQRTAITGPINKALKAINDLFRPAAEALAEGERLLKTKMLDYSREQERIAAEQRRRAEEAAAAERRRAEEEAADRAAEARRLAEEAAAAAAAGDAQAAEVATSNMQRAQAEAQAAANTAAMVVAPVVAIEKPAAKGISTSKKIDFEVVDTLALIKHIAAHPELAALVRVDDVKLRAYVRGLGMATNLPGVRVFEDAVMSARAA
jgi:colicin import membrane protein